MIRLPKANIKSRGDHDKGELRVPIVGASEGEGGIRKETSEDRRYNGADSCRL